MLVSVSSRSRTLSLVSSLLLISCLLGLISINAAAAPIVIDLSHPEKDGIVLPVEQAAPAPETVAPVLVPETKTPASVKRLDKGALLAEAAPVLIPEKKKLPGSDGDAVAPIITDASGRPLEQVGPEDFPEDFGDDDELFGVRGGYVHPYISLSAGYTDNLYNVDDNTVSSWETRVAPGIWFSLPRSRQVPVTIEPHNSSPGGLQYQIKDVLGSERYQAYALGALDYQAYSEDSNLNDTDGRLEGLFRWNFRGGLSLQLLDSFVNGRDRFGVDSATEENLRDFNTNLFMATADYDITEKVRVKLDYSNFLLDYEDDSNDWLDRTDNTADAYAYYKYSPKTSVFLQYRYIDVVYDAAELKDNEQHYGYAGMTWDSTDKLSLNFKGGYQMRDYQDDDSADIDTGEYDWDGFTFDLQARYRMTSKTSFTLDGYRRSEESGSILAADQVTLGARLGYRQQLTGKIGAIFDLLYENSDYSQVGDSNREDNRVYLKPALRYLPMRWLMFELAYTYDRRDSTEDIYDYASNSLILNVSMAL